jgi:uncharacterized protein
MPIPSVVFAFLLSLAVVPGSADTIKDCHIGTYRLSDGGTVDIAPSDGDTLRWLMFSGERGQLHPQANHTWTSTYGWTDRPDGKIVSFSDCGVGKILLGKEPGERIDFDVSDVTFETNGAKLAGRLVLPKGSGRGPGRSSSARFRARLLCLAAVIIYVANQDR